MKTIKDRYYVPNNAALVVTGDVTAADIFARTDALYASWQKRADPFVKYPLVKHPPIPKSEVIVVEQPVTTFRGDFVWHGPSTVGKEVELTYAADVLSAALQEPSSHFQKALVDSGACVRASLRWTTQRNVGPISLSFEAAPERTDACVKAALAELPKMREPAYLSSDELRNAVHVLEVEQARERERSSRLAHTLTFWWSSASIAYFRGYLDHAKAVTPADFARYLDAYVIKKPFVFGAMVSPAMVAAGLGRAHLEELAGVPVTTMKKAPAGATKEAK